MLTAFTYKIFNCNKLSLIRQLTHLRRLSKNFKNSCLFLNEAARRLNRVNPRGLLLKLLERNVGVFMNDLMSDTAWKKALELVKEKYGKNLSYRAIKLLENETQVIEANQSYTHGEDLVIPLKIRNLSLGDIIVDRGSFLNQQQRSEVTDLVKFLIEPKLYSMQLKKSEENLHKIASRNLSLVEAEEESIIELYNSEKIEKQTLSQIILLKSHTELTRNKVALKIHEMTGRNLFVHLDDIVASLSSKEDIGTLNDMTIYIDDIAKLSPATLNLLGEYLKLNQSHGPLFLVGSSLPLEAIDNQPWPEALKKDLKGFYFDIDRVPLAQQTSEEVLELLFFQLDSMLS